MRKYHSIFRDDRKLLTASRIARYLHDNNEGGFCQFCDYLPPEVAYQNLVHRILYRVEQNVFRFLSRSSRNRLYMIEPTK